MDNKINMNEIDISILCGGLGKRLRPILPNRQKVLANIKDEITFIDILIDQLYNYKIRRIILCSGYLKEQIRDHFNLNTNHYLDIIFSEEDEPLGTGGAILNAIENNSINSKTFMVLNGDSICNIDNQEFLDFHTSNNGILSMVLTKNNKEKKLNSDKEINNDYGSVRIDQNNQILDFNEKINSDQERLINAGIYLMDMDIYSYILNLGFYTFSLEYDLFPRIIKDKKCFGFVTDKELLDIGNPDRYKNAYKSLEKMGIKKMGI